ncbi:hypothetical protein GCM10007392_17710 [Saccharospirillum salsuginis]|uniref:Uncharacterized protein n=1 Tax=Saccharospirillum salsuginis TaxID=418750 RepID=A0A918K6E7_9GAMM|nr:hypothetical protein GCM10007392_17710 [Saccharospirillum salsuginis]
MAGQIDGPDFDAFDNIAHRLEAHGVVEKAVERKHRSAPPEPNPLDTSIQ